ncbi:MAG: fibronectin/fibrinogen-binding protein [Ruminococcaceae bacterium]|nr:fibronectin/fibrinogen-binding protein [Oscillospiraceae bacterium]
MAFDAAMLSCVINEIASYGECKVEKIYQPANDEIVLLLHTREKNLRLLINAGSNCPRINITATQAENPQKAPMLCMLLRKHLSGSKMTAARTLGFERVCEHEFDAYDEMGFKSKKYLICEIMGKYSNIILTDSNKKILALLKSVDFSVSMQRQLLVGMIYELPPKQDKLDTGVLTRGEFLSVLDNAPAGMKIDKFISNTFSGIALSTSRQIAYKTCGSIDGLLENCEKSTLLATFFEIIDKIRDNCAKPYLIVNESNEPIEFSYTPLEYYGKGYSIVELSSFGELVDAYFTKKGKNERIRQKSSDILKLLANAESRILKKLDIQAQELIECEKSEEYRIMADLLTSNLHALKRGGDSVKLVNYYDESCPLIEIPLDSRLSPSQNAQRYYKKYNKFKKAKIELNKQIELGKKELEYIATVFDSLTKADGESDLAQIRDELYHSGYASRMKNYSAVKSQAPKPLKFVTSGGYTVLCGKNNTQNDYITTKLAEKTDWWFHVKNLPGSHVLMQCKEEPGEVDFTEAAQIAAYYSKAEGNNIAVDYTNAKHVKKPAGSKPGYVIYHVNWTAYVTPDEKKIKEMQVK